MDDGDDLVNPLVRTFFGDEAGWERVVAAATRTTAKGHGAMVSVVDDATLDGAGWREVRRRFSPSDPNRVMALVADERAMRDDPPTVLVVDLMEENEPFRCEAGQIILVEPNLAVGNLLFEDFVQFARDDGGVLRDIGDVEDFMVAIDEQAGDEDDLFEETESELADDSDPRGHEVAWGGEVAAGGGFAILEGQAALAEQAREQRRQRKREEQERRRAVQVVEIRVPRESLAAAQTEARRRAMTLEDLLNELDDLLDRREQPLVAPVGGALADEGGEPIEVVTLRLSPSAVSCLGSSTVHGRFASLEDYCRALIEAVVTD